MSYSSGKFLVFLAEYGLYLVLYGCTHKQIKAQLESQTKGDIDKQRLHRK